MNGMGNQTVVDLITSAAETASDKVWLVDTDNPETGMTYGELVEKVGRVAGALRQLGVGRGDTVALSLRNRPEFLLAWFAVNWLGASMVPLNIALREREATYIVSHSEAKFWVVDDAPDLESVASAVARTIPAVGPLIGVSDIAEFAATGPIVEPERVQPDDLASILYTSGTTGEPKGCLCPHSYYATTGARFVQRVTATAEDRFSTSLPLFHISAQTMSTMGSLVSGASLAIEERFDASGYFERLTDYGATIISYVGAIPSMLLAQPPSSHDRGHNLRVAYGGGINPDVHAAVEARFGVPWVEGYGMTEVGMCMGTSLLGDRKVGTGCCGEAFEGVETRLIDDDGNPLDGAGTGQLLLAGAGLFRGYHKLESTTAFDEDGWFHTGDILRRDKDGDFYFVDRSKHVIRRSGENISAKEVESVLSQHDAVSEVAVIGVPDEIRGQEVKAFIVVGEGYDGSETLRESLLEHAREVLAYFKVPTYVSFIDEMPKTASLRIRKHLLVDRE